MKTITSLLLIFFLLSFTSFAQTRTNSENEKSIWLKNVTEKNATQLLFEKRSGNEYPDDLYYGIDNFHGYNYYQINGSIAPGIGLISDTYYKSVSQWTPYYDRPSNCSTADYKPELNRIFSTSGMPTENDEAVIQRQPRPMYSKAAYSAKTEGTIKLKVQLKADGTVGKITPLNSLPNGLTESATKAACFMTFYPAAANKKYVDSIQTISYTFKLNQVDNPNTKQNQSSPFTVERNQNQDQPVKILSKPRPTYTDEGRRNEVVGVVSLKVTFLASGKIGDIVPVEFLPDGLTENAVEAAKLMKFEPAKKNGKNITTTKVITYPFSIY